MSIDQMVYFRLDMGYISICIFMIYAPTYHMKIKSVWVDLDLIHNSNPLPWGFLGDFNSTLGGHKHSWRVSPSRSTFLDFENWIDQNSLVDLETHGAFFTWCNGRICSILIERRLDKNLFNQPWVTDYIKWNVFALPKLKSDNFPFIFDINFNAIRTRSQFKFYQMWTLNDNRLNLIQSY